MSEESTRESRGRPRCGHIINLVVTNEWFAVAGGVLEVIGLVFVARGALRRDAEQAGRAA